MRLKRGKEGRKTLQFYRLNFGITAPYAVLLDGNFIHAATSQKIDLKARLSKQLGVPVEELLQAFDTVGHWRAQYADRIGDFRLPGTAPLDGSGVRLLRALSGPVKSGAPSRKRNVGANRAARDALKKRHAAS